LVEARFIGADGRELAMVQTRIERKITLPSGRDLGDSTLLPGEQRTIPMNAILPEAPIGAVVTIIFDRLANIASTHDLDVPNRTFQLDSFTISPNQVVH